jgi:uncharacterized protein YndB with AHSA1/START domain
MKETTMTEYPHYLDRTITIEAPQDLVFRYFTTNDRWAAWWGPGSTIDARSGGRVYIRYPNGIEVGGEVLEVRPPERIVFSYGFASGDPIPIGASRVSIRLERAQGGTRVLLHHEFAEPTVRDHHVQGWRYQLSVFANVVLDHLHASVESSVDAWFSAWSEVNHEARTRALGEIGAPDVRMRDRFSAVQGIDELSQHIGAAHKFMPGLRMEKSGTVRHCQGMVLADWIAKGPDGQQRAAGANVFVFGEDRRIESVTGFW